MKKLLLSALAVLGVVGLMGCDVSSLDPITYNDSLVDLQGQALDAYGEYDTLITETPLGGDFDAVEAKRLETIDTINGVIAQVKATEEYLGDTTLRDAFVDNLEVLISSLENEEKRLVELYISRSALEGDLPEAEIAEEESLLQSISDKDDVAYETIITIQEAFADKYNYSLEADEEGNELE